MSVRESSRSPSDERIFVLPPHAVVEVMPLNLSLKIPAHSNPSASAVVTEIAVDQSESS